MLDYPTTGFIIRSMSRPIGSKFPHSEETKRKIREKRKYQVFSDETRKKLSEISKLRIGEKAQNWRGGRKKIDGYIYIYSPNHPHKDKRGYVCEHRLIIERNIGRYLSRQEVVHHIDKVRDNNLLSNLVLYSSDKEHHSKEHVTNRIRNNKGMFI